MDEYQEVIPAQRRATIMSLLAENGSVTIKELEALFHVSHMTVHRDLDMLERIGEVKKVRGGAVPGATGKDRKLVFEKRCDLCGMRVPTRTEVVVLRHENEALSACCAHCGLLLLAEGDDIESALGRDFLYGRMTSLFEASYLIDSEVRPCCMPSTLCFATVDEARRFQQGFGGQVLNLEEAIQRVTAKSRP